MKRSQALRIAAITLIVLGTVVGSLGGARLPRADAVIAGVGLALLAAGAVLYRLADRAARAEGAAGGPTGGKPGDDVLAAMRAMPPRLDALAAEAPELSLAEVVARLTAVSSELGEPIAEGAPRLLPRLGTTRFAEVFGLYAAGERSLARAWSAAADQHRPETLDSLRAGAERVRAAVDALDATSEVSAAPAKTAGNPSTLQG